MWRWLWGELPARPSAPSLKSSLQQQEINTRANACFRTYLELFVPLSLFLLLFHSCCTPISMRECLVLWIPKLSTTAIICGRRESHNLSLLDQPIESQQKHPQTDSIASHRHEDPSLQVFCWDRNIDSRWVLLELTQCLEDHSTGDIDCSPLFLLCQHRICSLGTDSVIQSDNKQVADLGLCLLLP